VKNVYIFRLSLKEATMNKKSLKLQEITGLTIPQIAKLSDYTPHNIRKYVNDHSMASTKFALKLEQTTGVNHQFFLYTYPLCLQFAVKVK
jgi:plasmid maintenance system antidote protein VapI